MTEREGGSLLPAVFIMGPTACGKTELALRLVQTLPMDIVSVDSAMVYRGMDIGTAKPDGEVLRRAPHRLIDFLDPGEAYSAARFREDALREMAQISAAGRIPLLVGGTMLYFRALLHGLAPLPSADEAVRQRLLHQAQRDGWGSLHARLAEVDPQAAARIHPNDPQRLQRALEVYELTGTALSEWQAAQSDTPLPYHPVKIGLIPHDRQWLHSRIAARFHQMLEQGLVEEVRRLYWRGDLHPDLPAIRAVGYRQVWAYLEGELGYEEMVDRGIVATRQLAKRQLTWLRSEPDLKIFDCQNRDLAEGVLKALAADHIKSP